jgi:hypothetical protein
VSRRNSDRLETPEAKPDEASPASILSGPHDNPLGDILSFVSPTEIVDIPSKGLLYPPNHPLHNIDSIEIRHMTAKEEDILTSESLIAKGIALDRLLQSLIINKDLDVNDLLTGDKNALLIAARMTGYGPLYNTSVECPACGTVKEDEINLQEVECRPPVIPENVALTDNGTYVVDFTEYPEPLQIEIRLLRGRDETSIAKRRESRKKMNLDESFITDQLQAIIVRVNGITDRSTLNEFASVCPAIIARKLRKVYESVMPNIDLTYNFHCDSCGHEGKAGIPLTVNFFWPDASISGVSV